jgi:hypothetical protein
MKTNLNAFKDISLKSRIPFEPDIFIKKTKWYRFVTKTSKIWCRFMTKTNKIWYSFVTTDIQKGIAL